MRVLVVGRGGQLARSLLTSAMSRTLEITATGRPEIELGTPASLRAAIDRTRPDVVINAAAYTAVDKAESERAQAYSINAEGAAACARATATAGIPLIHVSTDYVFDGTKSGPYVETDPTCPINVYGASKLEGEWQVAALNPRHVIVRTAWLVSPFGTNFCKTMLRLAAERDELRVVSDQIGSPTYAIDLAGVLLSIAEQVRELREGDPRCGIYHVANSGTTNWAQLATATLAASGRHGGRIVPVRGISTAEYPTPARRPRNSQLDCYRVKSIFGVVLPPWRDAMERCVDALWRGDT